ncbi:3-deoxy-7-phosphoheptulonate synthase [Chlamydiota bacterium]
MIVILKDDITEKQKQKIITGINKYELQAVVSQGAEKTIIGVIGTEEKVLIAREHIEAFDGVSEIVKILKPYKLVGREFKKEKTRITIGQMTIGDKKIQVIAGPCSVENKEMLFSIASQVKSAGATILRGGAFKPRTSPYSFQGLGEEGLKILREAGDTYGLLIITEVMDPRVVHLVEKYADIFQIGARNMQNYDLLKEVGFSKKPVFLKRGMSATIEELLMSAEYVMSSGNYDVILCERGIRTFETYTRNTLDISAIPVINKLSHLPVFIDPSHAAGKRDFIGTLSLAGVAAGADGLMIEVHNDPEVALSDGVQSILPKTFHQLMEALIPVAEAVGREI